MAKLRILVISMLLCTSFFWIVGPGRASSSLANPKAFDVILQAWRLGDEAEFIRQSQQVNWSDPAILNKVSISNVTEQELQALNAAGRVRSKGEALELALAAYSLQHHAFVLAEQKEIAEEGPAAQEYYQRVQQLGNALAHPDRLEILRVVGKALAKKAREKLLL